MMGHTRLATQGDCRRNFNNHPFPGLAGETAFALAHNGVLCNDGTLRRRLALPKTRIETDSYVAVQLIEQRKSLTLDSLQYMAEQVQGSFSFTVLSERNDLYIVKGDSPFCLHYYPKQGLYVYCSTEPILRMALSDAGLRLRKPCQVVLEYGDILRISSSGALEQGRFRGCEWALPYRWRGIEDASGEASYLEALMSVAGAFGITPEDIDRLHKHGFALEEIEDALYGREL